MPDNSTNRGIPKKLREMLSKAGYQARGKVGPATKKIQAALRRRLPKSLKNIKGLDPKQITQYPAFMRWVLILITVYLFSGVATRMIGLLIRPSYTPVPPKRAAHDRVATPRPGDNYDSITRRNMFNVEGKIPDAFDQGLLDCFSQARPSTQRLVLHGTLVTNSDTHSVALVQEEGKSEKIAVTKDDVFFDKYLALSVDRKKLCFQVQATQELEFIQIPEENMAFGTGAFLERAARTDGITATSETSFSVNKTFLDEKLSELNQILQTAKAVPYIEPGTNKFRGFLVQSIDPDSPFASLGIRQGDVLTGVNDIDLDNHGKGFEAFTRLKNSPKVSLRVIRGGREIEFSYEVK